MRGPVKIIHRKNDLKKNYMVRLELGFIISLLVFIGLFNINIKPVDDGNEFVLDQQETVYIEEIVQTKQELKAPPPPKPVIPMEVPNDEIIEDELIELDAELNINELTMDLPPPPKAFEEEEEEEIFVVVEQMPELIGGITSVQQLINYPEMALNAGIEGRVVVQFVIDEEGNVNEPVVVRGIGGGCDEEAVRAVSQAKFIPGKQRGKPVRVRYSLPVTFRLDNS